MRTDLPRVTFGIIVLNGEPFIRYNLRALYPFAHQILVVEGASPFATAIATPDGHSRDGTLEAIRAFQREEDPEGKVELVTAEDAGHPSGFWPGEKDEQSGAYAERATGDWLWQVDVDEFYLPQDMERLLGRLAREPEITAASFVTHNFWGGIDYVTDGWYLRRGGAVFHRLFRFGPGYRYATHRPPTVLDPEGRDLRSLHPLTAQSLAAEGIFAYHYCLLFPRQVEEKSAYYARVGWARKQASLAWAEHGYARLDWPFHVHNVYEHPSWLERFHGEHPPEVLRMMEDAHAGRIDVELRRTDDIERLLDAPWYALGIRALEGIDPVSRACNAVLSAGKQLALRALAAGRAPRSRRLRRIRERTSQAVRRLARPVADARARALPSAVVLLYHRVAEIDGDRQSLGVHPDRFREHVRHLAEEGCVIPLATLAEDLARGEVRPGAVVVTFDDGYADNFQVARPILEEAGVPATMFVTGSNVATQREFWWDELERALFRRGTVERELELELGGRWRRFSTGTADEVSRAYAEIHRLLRGTPAVARDAALDRIAGWAGVDRTPRPWLRPMTVEEVRRLGRSRSVTVGAHAMSHSVLSVETEERQRREIQESRRYLEGLVGRPVEAFSYPFGSRADYTETTARIVAESGFRCATANHEGRVLPTTSRYAIPRFLVRDWPPEVFARALDGYRWLAGNGRRRGGSAWAHAAARAAPEHRG